MGYGDGCELMGWRKRGQHSTCREERPRKRRRQAVRQSKEGIEEASR